MDNFTNESVLELTGQVEAVIYRNDENGYTVIELAGEDAAITATGTMPMINVGETVKLYGTFKNHPTYGEQFIATACERAMPESLDGILKYLSSGAVKGIGPASATRLVLEFGENTLNVLENEPQRVGKLKGFSERKANDISEQLKRMVGIRELMIYLSAYSVSSSSALKIWKRYGNDAIAKIEENPYILCEEGTGISFETADALALRHDYSKDARIRVRAALTHVLSHNKLNGHTCLPKDKLCDATSSLLEVEREVTEAALSEMTDDGSLIEDMINEKEFLFLPTMFDCEQYIAARLKTLLRFPAFGIEGVEKKIEEIEQRDGIRYADLQKKAIREALTKGLLILTGGPGTGKTTTLNAIIRLLKESGQTVMLCAPTGRAAQRMSEVTREEAKTIHRTLEVNFSSDDTPKFKHNERNLLKCDALIIDEVSMVDSSLMESVMRALPLACRLILVGDSNQLPSIGAGNVLYELTSSSAIPTVELTEIFRQSMQSLIVRSAHRIIKGEMPDLSIRDNDFFFIPTRSYEETADLVTELCAVRLKKAYGYNMLDNIQVLSPSRKNLLGTFETNNRLQNAINPKKGNSVKVGYYTLFVGDKVMQSRNNYDILWTKNNGDKGEGIFNGEIGVVTEINPAAKLYKVRFDDKEAEYDADSVSDLELAYACTVHKSQGNEFDCVILPLYRGAPQLMYRNLLYTAVTRAKKMLIMVGDQNALRMMVENNRRQLRYSALKEFLLRE